MNAVYHKTLSFRSLGVNKEQLKFMASSVSPIFRVKAWVADEQAGIIQSEEAEATMIDMIYWYLLGMDRIFFHNNSGLLETIVKANQGKM